MKRLSPAIESAVSVTTGSMNAAGSVKIAHADAVPLWLLAVGLWAGS